MISLNIRREWPSSFEWLMLATGKANKSVVRFMPAFQNTSHVSLFLFFSLESKQSQINYSLSCQNLILVLGEICEIDTLHFKMNSAGKKMLFS